LPHAKAIWSALFLGWIAMAAGTGCASGRPAPTLPPVRLPPSEAAKIEHRSAPPITEEVLPPDTPVPSAPGSTIQEKGNGPASQPEPDSLIAMIQPTTAPNVAAATRLVQSARAELSAGRTDAAVENLEQAIAIDASNAYAYYFLAEIHFTRGSYDQAVVFADKAALLSARLDPSWASRSYCLQGRIFEASGRFADARASYGQAIEADGENRTAWEGLARLGGAPPERP
jgi:predicted negative regulator of RcsB-dependent stress response